MASQISLLSSILLLILFHVIDPTCRASISIPSRHKQTSFRATLNRAILPKNRRFPKGSRPGFTSSLNVNGDEYTMNLNIGTPPIAFKAVIDTGSDLIWAKCINQSSSSSSSSSFVSTTRKKSTVSSTSFSAVSVTYSSNYRYKYYYSSSSSPPQNTSSVLFDPLKSQSFSKVNEPCTSFDLGEDCKMSYADKTAITFLLGRETLSMETTSTTTSTLNFKFGLIGGVTLGCGVPDGDGFAYDGIVGMGRGKVSLLSQLKERVFGYCLPWRFSDDDGLKKGVFVTGSAARKSIGNDGMIQTTPLLRNSKQGYDSWYYVSLEGISVGETRLNVTRSDFALSADQSGGMVVDSGATFTSLEDRIVSMIKDEFLKQTKLKKSEVYKAPYKVLDLCFDSNDVADIELPKIVFHFEGNADWEMSGENYIYKDGSQPQSCFAIITYGDDKTSVLGNIQQQNMMVVYDLDGNSLSFKPAKCNELV